MNNKFSRKLIFTAVAASLVAESGPLLAQGALEEVVVTARKREESILKVPVTVSVLAGDTLDQYAIDDVKGIADRTPGLNFGEGPLSSGVLVSMRGIGTGTNNPTIDQSVALVVDGMQMTQGLAFQAATLDMAQVEVMKGPQALFFGKAAPAGVISIRSADPGDEPEVSLRVGYEFEAEEQLGELILSGPVTDTLGLRLAAQFSDAEGYFENESVPADHPFAGALGFPSLGAAPVKYDDYPNSETLLLRGTAVWRPTDRFDARLKLNYADNDTQGSGGNLQYAVCPEGTASPLTSILIGPPFAGIDFIGGTDCKVDEKSVTAYMDPAVFPGIYNGGIPFMDLEQFIGSLEWNYDLGNDLTLTSVTGYYDMEQQSLINGADTTIFGSPFAIQGQMERDDLTQELRLTSNYSGVLNFMVGAFYQDGQTDYLSHLPFNQAYAIFGSAVPPALAMADHSIDSETMSLFGQVLWAITPELELGVGARWTDEERDFSSIDLLRGGIDTMVARPKLDSDNWSPEVSLTWTPGDDLTVYGNIKQAWKSGSYDTGGAIQPGEDNAFDDERVRGGEIGVKSRLMGGSLALNAAGYYYEFKDLQVEANEFQAGTPGVRTTNAASAELYGIDLDLTYVPAGVEGLTLFAAINWNEAEYDEFDNALCYYGQTVAEGCDRDFSVNALVASRDDPPAYFPAYTAQDLSGAPLLRAPEWTGNIGFDYETPVADGLTLRVGSNVSYSDEYSASLEDWSEAYQDDYTKVAASIALSGQDERWTVELIGDNLTDEIVYGKCTVNQGFADAILFGSLYPLNGTGTEAGGVSGKGEAICHVERGRSVWLRLTWNFF